jgi:hypothetical protein
VPPQPISPAPAATAPVAATNAAAAAETPAPAAVAVPPHGPGLRLTLAETAFPFTGGRFLADARRRWSAAAWDIGSLLAIAVSIFVVMDAFWMPFGITALCYYIGGILILGNSPGVCLFAPRSSEPTSGGSKPSRVPRHRPADTAPVRQPEPAYRTARFRAERRRELHG